jgi:hypothetical protein
MLMASPWSSSGPGRTDLLEGSEGLCRGVDRGKENTVKGHTATVCHVCLVVLPMSRGSCGILVSEVDLIYYTY